MDLQGLTGTYQLPAQGTAASSADIRSLLAQDTAEGRRAALRKAANEFEAVFVRQMVAAMRKTVGDHGVIRKSNGQRVFESMLDEEWARKLAGKNGPNGLSEVLYRQLSRQMGLSEEEAPPASVPGAGAAAPAVPIAPLAVPRAHGRRQP